MLRCFPSNLALRSDLFRPIFLSTSNDSYPFQHICCGLGYAPPPGVMMWTGVKVFSTPRPTPFYSYRRPSRRLDLVTSICISSFCDFGRSRLAYFPFDKPTLHIFPFFLSCIFGVFVAPGALVLAYMTDFGILERLRILHEGLISHGRMGWLHLHSRYTSLRAVYEVFT